MKIKLLILGLILAAARGFAESASADDMFDKLSDRLCGNGCLERVAASSKVDLQRLAGTGLSVRSHSYMATKPFRLTVDGKHTRMDDIKKSFVKDVVATLVEDMKKIGCEVNYSKDWPYDDDGQSSGSIRIKTKKGDDPALAAVVDVRLFGIDDKTAMVMYTFSIIYLDNPDLVPNLQPEPMNPRANQ